MYAKRCQAMQAAKKRNIDPGMVVLTRPPFLSKKETRRLTVNAPEPASFGGKAFDKILKDDRHDEEGESKGDKKPPSLLDSSVVGKDASHLLQ